MKIEDREEGGLDRDKMELIRGFLVYMARTYQDMNPYLKGLHLTLDSWRQFRENGGWIIHRDQLKLEEMEGKWEREE